MVVVDVLVYSPLVFEETLSWIDYYQMEADLNVLSELLVNLYFPDELEAQSERSSYAQLVDALG
jgi:hypothetical protein